MKGFATPGRRRLEERLRRFVLFAALMIPLVGSQGCYHYYVIAEEAQTEDNAYSEKTLNTFLWGLVNSNKDGVDSNMATTGGFCPEDHGLYDVRITRNFGHILAASLTAGIWSPLKVEWRCAKKASEEGDPL